MNSVSRCALSSILALSLGACVTTNASILGTATATRPPVPAQRVALYRVASQVPGPYEEVALLNSSGDSGMTDEAKMFESMKEKAGEIGANAVILDAVSEPGSGAKVAAAIFGVSAQRKGKALAIWVFPSGYPLAAPNATLPAARPEAMAVPPAAPVATPGQSQPAAPCRACDAISKSY